jgi:hypothetical protein
MDLHGFRPTPHTPRRNTMILSRIIIVRALRHRLFSGLITNQDKTDGYGADFLFDTDTYLGIAPRVTHEIMMRHNV